MMRTLLFNSAIEEPSVSRRRAHFGEPVQPGKEFLALLIRCVLTSDVPVACASRFALWAKRIAWPSLRSFGFREENQSFLQNEDIFHHKVPFLDVEHFGCSSCPWMPARTIILGPATMIARLSSKR